MLPLPQKPCSLIAVALGAKYEGSDLIDICVVSG